jgi:hypothetical protein
MSYHDSRRGFVCTACPRRADASQGPGLHPVRLEVQRTKHAGNGIIIRYRKCPVCGFDLITHERERPRA